MKVNRITSEAMTNACGEFLDLVRAEQLFHLDDPVLNAAVEGAVQRDLGDAWAWARRKSANNVSPLVAASLAVYAVSQQQRRPPRIHFLKAENA